MTGVVIESSDLPSVPPGLSHARRSHRESRVLHWCAIEELRTLVEQGQQLQPEVPFLLSELKKLFFKVCCFALSIKDLLDLLG